MSTLPPALQLEMIPWARIVHFYGRATAFPEILGRLASGSASASHLDALSVIECQDGIIQATPFTALFLADFIRSGSASPQLRGLCGTVLGSARFQLSQYDTTPPPIPLEDLLSKDRLWPEFQSDEDDEIYWGDWRPNDEDRFAWAAHTAHILTSALFD